MARSPRLGGRRAREGRHDEYLQLHFARFNQDMNIYSFILPDSITIGTLISKSGIEAHSGVPAREDMMR